MGGACFLLLWYDVAEGFSTADTLVTVYDQLIFNHQENVERPKCVTVEALYCSRNDSTVILTASEHTCKDIVFICNIVKESVSFFPIRDKGGE